MIRKRAGANNGKPLYTIVLIMIFSLDLFAQTSSSIHTDDSLFYLNIPDRPVNTIGGSDFVAQVAELSTTDREAAAIGQILSGNVPMFSRTLRPIRISQSVHGEAYELICFVACDYLAIGSVKDYIYMPFTPAAAQFLADQLNCSLPTEKIVNLIYANSHIRLTPQPIPPSDTMTTIPVFVQHTDSIQQQFSQLGYDRSPNMLVAGHKKDIIISNKIYSPDRDFDRVVIYGWHLSESNPIQPVYNGHIAGYADYSHGVRFIAKQALINGNSVSLEDILRDPHLSELLSDEGVIYKPYYPGRKP